MSERIVFQLEFDEAVALARRYALADGRLTVDSATQAVVKSFLLSKSWENDHEGVTRIWRITFRVPDARESLVEFEIAIDDSTGEECTLAEL